MDVDAIPLLPPRGVPSRERCGGCAFFQAEMERAVAKRDEYKTKLDSVDGPIAEYRRDAARLANRLRGALHKVTSLQEKVTSLQVEMTGEVTRRTTAEELADGAHRRVEDTRRALWEVWSGLSDDTPIKAQLWAVWSKLA